MYLPDVNVWLAASWDRHEFHGKAKDWISQVEDPLYFCRVTQLAFLRLSTHPSIMREDALTRSAAWKTYRRILDDPRVERLNEPETLDTIWETLSARSDRAHKLWTDDYLAAFATAANLTFVTLDRAAAKRYPSLSRLIA